MFVLVGFGFKVSAVPFHNWAPDTYEGAPTPVTAFLSVASKAAGFVALMELIFVGLLRPRRRVRAADVGPGRADDDRRQPHRPAPDERRAPVRLLVGRPGRLHPRPARGGRARARASAADAIQAVVIYLVIYTAMNLGAFAVIIAVARKTALGRDRHLRRPVRVRPGLAVAMTVFLFALAGIPPLGGWFAKFEVFKAILSEPATPSGYRARR